MFIIQVHQYIQHFLLVIHHPDVLALISINVLPLKCLHLDNNWLYDHKNYIIQLHTEFKGLQDQAIIDQFLLAHSRHSSNSNNFSHLNNWQPILNHDLPFLHWDYQSKLHLIFDSIHQHFHILNLANYDSPIMLVNLLQHQIWCFIDSNHLGFS
jgi:hypothetical protein